jgi:hypothetical protein
MALRLETYMCLFLYVIHERSGYDGYNKEEWKQQQEEEEDEAVLKVEVYNKNGSFFS